MNKRQAKRILQRYSSGQINYRPETIVSAERRLSVDMKIVEEDFAFKSKKNTRKDALAKSEQKRAEENAKDKADRNEKRAKKKEDRKRKKEKAIADALSNSRHGDDEFKYTTSDYGRKSTISWMRGQLEGAEFDVGKNWKKADFADAMVAMELPPHPEDLD